MASEPGVVARATRGPGFKFVIVMVLTALMAASLGLISLALGEREQRSTEATTDVASGWGGAQVIAGPFLLVPYDESTTQIVDGRSLQTVTRKLATLLPTNLSVTGGADASERWRGIFKVPVYRSTVSV